MFRAVLRLILAKATAQCRVIRLGLKMPANLPALEIDGYNRVRCFRRRLGCRVSGSKVDGPARAIFDSATHDPLISGVSVALEVGDSIYLGAFQGDRLVRIPYPK
jgi:hypothetical protein